MKNHIILYLIVSLLITSHNAIKAQDCTYIYRNDGNINAFFNNNIDSLKYSKIDLNGTPKDTWVTQEIFTADSIYRIPLATIDSIGFITPETIYRPGVIKLEDGLMPYITECDSLTLYLAPSVPKEIIPHKGDRLVTLNMTDILPVGFAGKVIDVRTEKNEHVVECELTPLNDIFEQYYGSTNIPVEPQQASRAISTNPDPNHIRQFKISSQLSANIGAVAGTSDLGIGLSHSVGMEVTGNLYVQTFLIVRPFQPTLFSTTIIADINTENKFETSIKGYASHDFGPDIKANLPCAPLIQVFMSNGIYLRFNGEIVAKRSYSQSNKFIFHYEHNGNKEAVIPPMMKFVAGDTQDEFTEVYGSAVLGLGLYSEVGLGIFDKNIANVTVRGEAGVEIEANAEIVKEEDRPSTKTYDTLNYDDIISARLVSNSSISVKALCFEGGFNTGVVFEPYQLGKWGLVPEFIQPSFIKSPENQGSISATATVGRKCLIPTKVGYALYDKNNKRIDSWENPALYNNELFVMSHRFDNLKSNNEYTVYPYVKLLDNEYLATPNSKVELSVQITTDKASDIKNNSANLTGKIEDITQNDDYTCGFYWSSTSTVEAENGSFIPATVVNGETFSAQLDNLQPETTYYYRACATINGETLLADNTQSFTTEKEEDESIQVNPNHNIWITPQSAYFLFPDINSEEEADCIRLRIYTDSEFTNQIGSVPSIPMSWGWSGWASDYELEEGIISDKPYYIRTDDWGPLFKPSTIYHYRIIIRTLNWESTDTIIGSFKTSSQIIVTTPDINYNPEWENGIYFIPPHISGISEEMYNKLINKGQGKWPFIGTIVSDTPENLIFINPDIEILRGFSNHSCFRFEWGKTYYYRSYYTTPNYTGISWDINNSGFIDTEEEKKIGREIEHLSSSYGEIKQFTIKETNYDDYEL